MNRQDAQAAGSPSHRLSQLLAQTGKAGSRLLCGLLAAATLTLSVEAARTIPVQVDGAQLPEGPYLEQGVTYVPLRSLLDAFGGWDVFWDRTEQEAVAVSSHIRLSADPAEQVIRIDDEVLPGRVTVEQGRTYVPLRLVTEALGGTAQWDPYLVGAAVTTADAEHNAMDLYWLSRIIYAESGAEPLEGQIAVGNVVLNRVSSEEFPDTIAGVIFDRMDGVQFEPVENGMIYKVPSRRSIDAAKQVLDGKNTIGAAQYFYAPALSQGIWINANRPYHKTIGCHRFYL